jgi:hypothetical protein
MDLYGNLLAINNAPDRMRARQLRRARRRAEIYDRIGDAIGDTRVMEAAISWSIQQHDPERGAGSPIGSQHPGQAAIGAVHRALAEFNLPTTYDTRWVGTQRFAGSGPHRVDDGVIAVELTMHSLSGIDRTVDIPVIVKEGRLLEPVVLIDQGVTRAMTQQTFDDILRQATFTAEVPDRRTMFSPPPDERRPPNIVPLVRPGMFGFGPVNRQLTASYIRSAMSGQYETDLPSFNAMRDDPPPHIQWAEQPPPAIAPGDSVSLREGVDIVGRDGQRWHIESGTQGQVQRDVCGNGDCYTVFFPDHGFTVKVRGDLLR